MDHPDYPLIFHALADPMRRALLYNLAANSPRTATQLAQEYPITRQAIQKHLHILEQAGLVRKVQEGRDKYYSLTPQPLTDLEQWAQEVTKLWDTRLQRLKNLLED